MRKVPLKPVQERGSALLIVFVFAAFVAIMLYMEMPVAVFEAQRNKEQLLIDRGNEYARAVKLYVRKVGQYPPSFDALENTNRMRFLRKRYKDPFTGKDDWRLLHAGPNGILIDSKVNPIGNTTGAGNSPLNASNKSAGNSTFGGFNSSSSSSTSSNSTFSGFDAGGSGSSGTGEVVVPKIPQRPPTIAANGEGSSGTPANQDPFAAMNNAGAPAAGSPAGAPGGNTADPNAGTNTPQTAANGATAPNANPANPQAPGANPALAARPNAAFAPGSSPFGTASTSSSSGLGVIQSGGIAGVASKAEGHGIKTVNDQEDYSLWEFYYDPSKDATKALAGAVAQMAGKQPTNGSSGFNSGFGGGPSGVQNSSPNGFSQSQGTQNTNNSFGSFGNSGSGNSGFGNSGFGNSGFGNSGFGNSNSPNRPPVSPPPSPPQ